MKKIFLVLVVALMSCSTNATTNAPDLKNISCTINNPKFDKVTGIDVIQSWGKDLVHYQTIYKQSNFKVDNAPAEFTANHYTQNAVLLPTLHSKTRVGLQEINDYFDGFMTKDPHLVLTKDDIKHAKVTLTGCGYGFMSGYYSFLSKGKLLKASYTMQFHYQADPELVTVDTNDGHNITVNQNPGWYIATQHSSMLPL
jgi:hypothetical protein